MNEAVRPASLCATCAARLFTLESPGVANEPSHSCISRWTVFRGIAIGRFRHERGRGGVQYLDDWLSGILTDPSYCKQIVTLTYPHIGNVGVNTEDVESRQVFASGLVIRDLSLTVSKFSQHAISSRLPEGK